MVKYLKALPLCLCVILVAIFLLMYPTVVAEGIRDGLTVCGGVIIPSLFPFMVISIFIARSNLCSIFGKIFAPLTTYIFRLPKDASAAILMSFIGGFPVGAKMIFELQKSQRVTARQAARMHLFCINAGPAFVISTIGSSMLGSTKAGVILFASVTLSSLIIGFFSSLLLENDFSRSLENTINESEEKTSQIPIFISSAKDASLSMLNICSWIILFSGICAAVSFFPLSSDAAFLLKCSLEVTNGCLSASGVYPIPVLAAVIGFSGFCVHFQVYSYVKDSGLKISYFLTARLLNSALSAAICTSLLIFFPCDTYAFATSTDAVVFPYQISLPSCIAFIAMSILLIFEVAPKKKVC